MSATSLEKQKKGSIYVYKFSTGSRTPEYQPPARSTTKKIIPSSVWGSLRKSKSKSKPNKDKEEVKEMDHGKPSELTVQQQQPSIIPLIMKDNERERERERKSVSSVESILMSLAKSNDDNKNEGRKSVEENKGRELFPFPRELLLLGKEEGARKSISHVENNVAYVGKFVEKPRKSIGVKLESDVVSAIEVLQVKVLVTDMPGFMQIQAFQCARKTYDSLEKFSAKHMAYNLKKEFDKVYGPAWHCIVGSSFGSFVTHATGCFLYFSIEKLCILLFRTKVQKILQQ